MKKSIKISHLLKLLTCLGILGCSSVYAETLTSEYGVADASSQNFSFNEVASNAFDSNVRSKWLAFDSTAWLSYTFNDPAVVASYTITSANDAFSRDPLNWVLQGSSDGADWYELDAQKSQVFENRHQSNNYPLARASSHTHFRLLITKNNGDQYTQIAELVLNGYFDKNTYDGNDITGDGVITFSDQIHSNESAEKAFDNSISTKWLARNNTAWINYQFPEKSVVYGYKLTSANDSKSRDPKHWTLEASNNNLDWTVLDTRNWQSFPGRHETNYYAVNNLTAFNYYRLNILSNNGDEYTQLAEIELIGDLANTVPLPDLDANFTALPTKIFEGDSVQYSGPSGMDSYSWEFHGGTPHVSEKQNPTVVYSNQGYYDASLQVTKGQQQSNTFKEQLVVVSEIPRKSIDITSDPSGAGKMQAKYASASGQGIAQLTDDSLFSKYLVRDNTSWVQHKGEQNYIVTGYTITSANDAPARDPKKWTLEGSSDGINFTVIDERDNQDWSSRNETRTFDFSNYSAYRYHRFNFTNHGVDEFGTDILQIAEVEILGVGVGGGFPTAKFTFPSTIEVGDLVTFSSSESKNAVSYLWEIERKRNSTESSTTHSFSKKGTLDVLLTVISESGKKDTAKGVIRVNPISDGKFKLPNINFIDEDPTHPGSIIYHQMIPDPISFIQEHSETLANLIYDDVTPSFINNVENITYVLSDYDGVSGKSGKTPNIDITLSTRYIKNKSDQLNGNTDEIMTEIRGVLYHELTHGYQWEPVGAGVYSDGTEFYGFIEGLADYSRLTLGFHPEAELERGGSYTSGYTTTAFFYRWLEKTYSIDRFGSKLNETARAISPWSLDKALRQIFRNEGIKEKSVSVLWREYQRSL